MEMPTSSLTGLTLKDLLDAGLHFGHQTRRWNPKMSRYIFDKRNGIHIIDLTQTVTLLDEAAAFLRDTVLSGKKVLFVATKKQAQEVVKEAAISCGQLYMTERWLGGTLTNNATIRRSVLEMRRLEAKARNNNGVLSVHKKEAASLRRQLDKLQRNLSGVADMDRDPGAVFIVDIGREQNALNEARRLDIPIVAMVDSNVDPDPVSYVIPGNDDAVRGIKLIVDAMAKVLKSAEDEYSRLAAERQQRINAERASQEAQERAARKSRKEAAESAQKAAKQKLTETRRRAAKAAKEAVEAKAAAVESVSASDEKPAPVETAADVAAEAVVEAPVAVETPDVVEKAAPVVAPAPVVESEKPAAPEAAEAAEVSAPAETETPTEDGVAESAAE